MARKDWGKLIEVDEGIPEELKVPMVSIIVAEHTSKQLERLKSIYEAFAASDGFNIAWYRDGKRDLGYYRSKRR